MIYEFNDVEMRNSGLIYNSTFNQIKQLHAMDPELAGELAISAIELVLTGGISSDDPMIGLFLEPMKKINENNHVKYDNKVENSRQKKIAELSLDKVAELMNQGYTQKQMGEKLHMSQQNISYRVNVIRTKYPELLSGTSTLQTVQTKNTNTSQTVQKVQTNSTNKVDDTNTLQTVQTDFTNNTNDTNSTNNEEFVEPNVCQSSVKPGGTKTKYTKEQLEKMGFNF
jgi:predicted transcriptional regulator